MFEYFEFDPENTSFDWDDQKEENTIRLISARLATIPENERYEHGEDEY